MYYQDGYMNIYYNPIRKQYIMFDEYHEEVDYFETYEEVKASCEIGCYDGIVIHDL